MEKKTTKKASATKKSAVKKTGARAKKAAPVTETEAAEDKQAVQVKYGLHILRVPTGAHTGKKLLGRGSSSGHGKTSTRGSKGQTSRAGRDMYLGFEGGQTPLIRRMPKRGFTSKFKKVYQIVNLSDLVRIKETAITLDVLEASGLIKDKNKLVKILGEGEVKQAVTIQAHAFSKSAQEKLKNSGSQFEVVNA